MHQFKAANFQSVKFLKKFQLILFVSSIVPSERIYSEFLTTKITVRKQWHLICCVSNFFFFLQFTKLGRCKMLNARHEELRKGSSIVIPLYSTPTTGGGIQLHFDLSSCWSSLELLRSIIPFKRQKRSSRYWDFEERWSRIMYSRFWMIQISLPMYYLFMKCTYFQDYGFRRRNISVLKSGK